MGQKKLQVKTQSQSHQHPQKSFQQTVAEAVNQKMLTTVFGAMQKIGNQIKSGLDNQLEDLYARVLTLEKLVLKYNNISDDQYAILVAETQDESDGLIPVEQLESGDVVRLTLSVKKVSDPEYKQSTKVRAFNIGSGQTYGKQIEDGMLGMKVFEEREITFGQDNAMVAKVLINKIARVKVTQPLPTEQPKLKEVKEEQNEVETM